MMRSGLHNQRISMKTSQWCHDVSTQSGAAAKSA
jgi:hypothetical protein